jgi:hypothetical protein
MKDAYNLSRWLMKNQEDAEDMVQESSNASLSVGRVIRIFTFESLEPSLLAR